MGAARVIVSAYLRVCVYKEVTILLDNTITMNHESL